MTHQQFKNWLDQLKNIWETRNPNEIINICTDNCLWYENPFKVPLKTQEQLLQEWQGILNQENILMSYEIFSIDEKMGIAQWKATFTRLSSGKKVALQGIFKVFLNHQGKCTEFHQWFNIKK